MLFSFVSSSGSRSLAGRRLSSSRRLSGVVFAGRLAASLSRRTGLGTGGVIGGRVLLALMPRGSRELARGRTTVLVSGTNGKTTTTAYIAAALRTLGPVDSNTDGANTQPGLAWTAAQRTTDRLILETDERWLGWARTELEPAAVVLLNLSRDQLHRHHEVAFLARTWRDVLADVPHVIANADDPSVVHAAQAASSQTWVAMGGRWLGDALVCPRCGDECRRSGVFWACQGCELRRPSPDWWIEGDDLVGPGVRQSLRLALPGLANCGNAAIAIATAVRLGAAPDTALAAIRSIASVEGRYAVFTSRQHRTRLILAKNPAGWAEALDIAAAALATPIVLAFNSEGVDGRDPSWLYDVPFTVLAGRTVVVTGRRRTDMHVRLAMEGLRDVRSAPDVRRAIAMLPAGDVHVIANYTAFQDARRVLGHEA